MYIIERKYESILENYVFDSVEQAIQYIKDYEEEGNTLIIYSNNKVQGKFDTYFIIKLERWKD